MNVTEQQLKEILENFDDWEWCKCNDCRIDCHSHAVDTEASKPKIAKYIIEELKKDDTIPA